MHNEKFTATEIAFIEQHYTTMTHPQIANKLGRTAGSIRLYCWRHGLTKQSEAPRWTQAEIDYLKQNANKLHLNTLAQRLGRPRYGVKDKITKLKLKKGKKILPIQPTTPRAIFITGNRTLHKCL